MKTGSEHKIFIVDDDFFCRELYSRHILNLGFDHIRVFENGDDCLNNINERPDIVFLDYNMEPYDGLELMQKIKEVIPDTHIILISGQKEIQVAVDALKSGAFDYIIKGDQELENITNAANKIRNMGIS